MNNTAESKPNRLYCTIATKKEVTGNFQRYEIKVGEKTIFNVKISDEEQPKHTERYISETLFNPLLDFWQIYLEANPQVLEKGFPKEIRIRIRNDLDLFESHVMDSTLNIPRYQPSHNHIFDSQNPSYLQVFTHEAIHLTLDSLYQPKYTLPREYVEGIAMIYEAFMKKPVLDQTRSKYLNQATSASSHKFGFAIYAGFYEFLNKRNPNLNPTEYFKELCKLTHLAYNYPLYQKNDSRPSLLNSLNLGFRALGYSDIQIKDIFERINHIAVIRDFLKSTTRII